MKYYNKMHIYLFIIFTELKNKVTAGDGRYKLVYAINGEVPGPNIVVFEDQIVSKCIPINLYV